MIIDSKSLSSRDAHVLLVSAIVPRPIAFITSMNASGSVNAAPYSFFNAVASSPPLLMVSAARKNGSMKHTAENILRAKEFVVNIVTEQLLRSMNDASANLPREASDFEHGNLTLASSMTVRTPGIAESPVRLECALHRHLELGSEPVDLIIGEILQFHIDDHLYSAGTIDQKKLKPIARMGGSYYAEIEHLFEIDNPRPGGESPGSSKHPVAGR
jgi:flavin reductase (DIM6/NTAB) family NADH-FMN oxidoreductase RutF